MRIVKRRSIVLGIMGMVAVAGMSAQAKTEIKEAGQEQLNGIYGEAYKAAGYEVTFIYEDADEAIEKVELFSQSGFQFYKEIEVGNYMITGANQAHIYSAYEYEPGMYPCAGETCYYEMEETGDGVYCVTLPLPATQYLYKYRVTYTEADGRGAIEMDDPENPAARNGDASSGWSQIYVGDSERALKGMHAIYPVAEELQGSVSYAEYEALDGTLQPLGIYLPYDYNEEKTYRTIYISHGSGGNETEWMSIGSVPNIMDQLNASGELQNTIVVTMSNMMWHIPDNPWIFGWDWEKMKDNLTQCIIPYMEEHYSVSSEANDRAFCGLSMGSIGASAIVQQWPETFGYYGCFSAANNGIDVSTWNTEAMKNATIFVSAGELDMALMNKNYDNPEMDNTSRNFSEHLTEAEIPHTFITFPGMHDWNVWVASFTCFAENILWK